MRKRSSLKFFGLCINALIDKGYSEEIDIIEKEMAKENLLQYLENKYAKEEFFFEFGSEGTYREEKYEINKIYSDWCGYIEGNESRKFWIKKNGLALVSSLCIEMLYDKKYE